MALPARARAPLFPLLAAAAHPTTPPPLPACPRAFPLAAQKRPASSLDDAAAAAALETPAKVRLGGGDVFNPVMMRYYYQHFFPFKQMFEWLSYGNGERARRERSAGRAARGCRARARGAVAPL